MITQALKTLLPLASGSKDEMKLFVDTGQTKWLHILVKRHQDELYKFLSHQISCELAADVTQKTWLKVIENKHKYQAQGEFRAWLYQIARNLMLDELRKNKADSTSELSELASDKLVPTTDELANQQHIRAFRQAFNLLPIEQREAISLQFEGFGLSEIAQITQQPIETVKTRIRYAKQKLKGLLAEKNDE
ncbi:RNA polymerase sigma factor [Catenovulum sp. SX2]|uniref:RNA polymerase sigma factor n=1 Tax=Catenovulum sp. SX2 TaxID=3398614 RepID=UPI003F82A746